VAEGQNRRYDGHVVSCFVTPPIGREKTVSAPPPSQKNVVLLIETSNEYARGLLRGIMAYIREHERWSIYLPEQGRGEAPPGWLKRWHGDGIIARIETPQIGRAVAASHLPAVDLSAGRHVPGIPWVETDDEAFSRAAVDHRLQRGFRQFGYCGEPQYNWSKWRREHFEQMVAQAGGQCYVYESTATAGKPTSYQREHRRLVAWVRKLPKPIGVMACYDIKGQQVLDACREAGIAVPEEVAVIGVDNDALLCNLASPPLSSVIPNTHRTGYQAAALLARMMAGEQLGEQAHRIGPLGIATRHSTDIVAVDDPDVAAAVRFIYERACRSKRSGRTGTWRWSRSSGGPALRSTTRGTFAAGGISEPDRWATWAAIMPTRPFAH
jgi:LacI family transcriptional regulator